jgi:DNA-binding NarL/FixJ family response regulator
MLLQAILVSRDVISTALISSAFRGAVVDIRYVRETEEALQLIAKSKFDALIVDYQSVPESAALLSALRKSKSNQRAIAFAIVNSQASAKDIFSNGANFILTRPVTAEIVTASLRAAHGLMVSERRRYLRHAIDSSCWLKTDRSEFQIGLHDVSEGGIGAEVAQFTAEQLNGPVLFRFFLPDSSVPIDGKAHVAWKREGKVGFQFTTLKRESRDELIRWLSRRFDVVAAEAVGKALVTASSS